MVKRLIVWFASLLFVIVIILSASFLGKSKAALALADASYWHKKIHHIK